MREPAVAVACVEALLAGGLAEGDIDAQAGVQWLVGRAMRLDRLLVTIARTQGAKVE
jgi:hypothetical protein